jgi:hypothetical protein
MQQRFCPLCDRVFQEGEAVLRCEGCGVLHHPGCWVTNGGCATQTDHRVAPAAMAYTTSNRDVGAAAPHPGEGTRVAPLPQAEAIPEPIPFPISRPAATLPPEAAVIGGEPPAPTPTIHRTLPSTIGTPVSSPRRYQPPPGEQMPRRQLPQIYEGNGLLRYWYVPAAVLVALFVAFSVIWVIGKLTGGDGGTKASSTPAATVSVAAQATQQSTPAASTTAAASSPTVATGPGKFKGGDAVLVTGTAPDCLNVRVKAGRENDAIVCVKDGTQLTVTGGPETASDLTWWKVKTELGEGWAAEDYLAKKP